MDKIEMDMEIEASDHKFITMIRSSTAKMNGYSLNFVKEYDHIFAGGQVPGIPGFHRLEFEVPTSKITVSFSFSIKNNHLLTVFIKNEKESFSVDEYFQKYKMKDMEDKFYVACTSGDWALSLEYIIEVFNGTLNEVITGRRWEHIEHDWHPYK